MTTPPTPPSPGKPISASFFARLIAWVKSGMLVEGSGYRLRRGPNGTALDIDVANLRVSSSKKIPGRFEILSITANEPQENDEEEDQERKYTVAFMNPYYDIGGKTYEMPASEETDPPAVILEEIKDGDIIVLKIRAGESRSEELVTVGRIQELQQLQEDSAFYSIPLYRIQGGAVVCDFRTGPISGMGEF